MRDPSALLRTSKRLIRELRTANGLREIRVAVLGGSTTQEIITFLEILLLEKGFAPIFWESEYGQYYEESVLDPHRIATFNPDLVYVHTTNRNLRHWPQIQDDPAQARMGVEAEISKLAQIWDAVYQLKSCAVIQNNFEMPALRLLGNLDSRNANGAVHFVNEVNRALYEEAAKRPYLILNDIHYLSAQLGLENWYDPSRWFSYKLATTVRGSFENASNVATLIAARYGLSKKCLVLDLDNTLWGGVIGDDGADRIVIGRETAQAEAYTAFQEYCLALKHRGVILAVSSKNNDEIAREGFGHPDSILKLTDFACFRANWEPKHENIKKVAEELNIGLDSLVFVDDNPFERALVSAQLPMVAVPDVGEDVACFASILDRMRYFEPISISSEDTDRAEMYARRAAATQVQATFASYQDYLDSLEMTAEVDSFSAKYLDRITQLTNKSNQFNLTTRRYSLAEMGEIAADPKYVTLYIKLSDKFGDHGLISVIIGRREATTLHIDLWLMSCRVLKRDVELLVLDELVARARELDLNTIRGYYLRTPKNDMVSKHYEILGFTPELIEPDRSEWVLDVQNYTNRNRSILSRDSAGNPRQVTADIS